MVLDIANNSSFKDRSEGNNIADDEGGLLTAVNELADVDSLDGDEQLYLLLVLEGVAERDLGERCTMTHVIIHHPLSLNGINAGKVALLAEGANKFSAWSCAALARFVTSPILSKLISSVTLTN